MQSVKKSSFFSEKVQDFMHELQINNFHVTQHKLPHCFILTDMLKLYDVSVILRIQMITVYMKL